MQRRHKGRRLQNITPIQLINKQTDKKEQTKIINIKQIDKGNPAQSTLEAWRGGGNIYKNLLPSYHNNNLHNNSNRHKVSCVNRLHQSQQNKDKPKFQKNK